MAGLDKTAAAKYIDLLDKEDGFSVRRVAVQAAGLVFMNGFRANPTNFPIRQQALLLLAAVWLSILPSLAPPCGSTALAADNLPELADSCCCQTAGEGAQTTAWQAAHALPQPSPACDGTCTLSGCDPKQPLVESQGTSGIEHRRLPPGPLPMQIACRLPWPESPAAHHRPPCPSFASLPAYLASSALRC